MLNHVVQIRDKRGYMKITTARLAYIPKHLNCSKVEPIYDPYSEAEKARVKTMDKVIQLMSIENQLSCDVWICFRNGTYTKMVKSMGIRSAKSLIITVDQSFTRPTNNEPNTDMLETFGVLDDNPTEATKAVHNGLRYRVSSARGGAVGNLVRYQITEDEIGSEENGVYIEELDLVVSLTNCFPNTLHPYSDAAKRYQASMEANTSKTPVKTTGLNFFIKIIDNESTFSPRFIRIGSNTFAIPSMKNSRLKDGVYVGGAEPVQGSRNVHNRSKFYTIDEADTELQLFKTVEEAQAAPETKIKEREAHFQEEALTFKRDQLAYSVDELQEKAKEAKRRTDLESARMQIEKDKLRDDTVRREHEAKLRTEHETRQRRQNYRNEILEVGKMFITVAGFYFAYTKLKK